MEGFWFEPPAYPAENSRLASYFPLKILLFANPGLSLKHAMTLLAGGYGLIFCNHTFSNSHRTGTLGIFK